ncbi:hypothetical protein PN36_28075 [Candidatus Thiomargarita nelsonii]|uniref:Uncharacterized protein n=1 Tax=Candidatus Thiomargarita nelsonii TaxID=1003181 RepID=A0A0A6P4Y1_9GAMM|nr:hypothetical protein PN36_28075 [Candidatus Thiomargarita nelsonii]
MNGTEELGATYFSIDGHVWNFAPELIAVLKATTPQEIFKNKKLIQLIGKNGLYDGVEDSFLDHLCEVDVSQDNYVIKLYGFEKRLDFCGSLTEFAEKYEEE